MKRTIRDMLGHIEAEAESAGAEMVAHGFGGSHPYAVIRHRGETRRLVFSGSPRSGTHYQRDWARQAVCRAVRDIELRSE